VLVGVLLDGRGDDPRRTDPVGAHPHRALDAGLVEVAGAERLRVAGAELEDVADLDRRLDLERGAVDGVARHHLAHVGDSEREVAAGDDPAQVRVGAVGTGHVAAVRLDGGVEHDVDLGGEADRAHEADRPERVLDLSGGGGPERVAERVRQLDLGDAVIAAQKHEDQPLGAVAERDHRERLQERALGDAE
jgi:hypothetical protein